MVCAFGDRNTRSQQMHVWSSCLACLQRMMAMHAAVQIGGVRAPSPVGELGNVEMTQALTLTDTAWRAVGPDMLLSGGGPLPPQPAPAALSAQEAIGCTAEPAMLLLLLAALSMWQYAQAEVCHHPIALMFI